MNVVQAPWHLYYVKIKTEIVKTYRLKNMSKYKYYFKQPKSEIVKEVFQWLTTAGVVCIAVTSPYFILNLIRAYKRSKRKDSYDYPKKRMYDTFYNLKKAGHIKIRKEGKQIYISLTKKGRKKADWLQINDLKVKKPRKWDGKWRIVIFDIAQIKKFYR